MESYKVNSGKKQIISNSNFANQKKTSLQKLILYRSLYILKRKFDFQKNQIMSIYSNYSLQTITNNNETYGQLPPVNQYKVIKENFDILITEVFKEININFIYLNNNPKKIFTSDLLITDREKESHTQIEKELINYMIKNIGKYNDIYYKKRLINEGENNYKNNLNSNEVNNIKTTLYDKKGKVIKNNSTLQKENGEFDINKINQEFKDIENDDGNSPMIEEGLYIETLPLIIADFLSENQMTYSIIDKDSYFNKEIKALFDDEILKKIEENDNLNQCNNISNLTNINNINENSGSEKNNIKELSSKNNTNINDSNTNQSNQNKNITPEQKELFELIKQRSKLNKKIELYENILIDNTGQLPSSSSIPSNTENKKLFIQNMLDKLLNQKILLEDKIKTAKKQTLLQPNSQNNNPDQPTSQNSTVTLSIKTDMTPGNSQDDLINSPTNQVAQTINSKSSSLSNQSHLLTQKLNAKLTTKFSINRQHPLHPHTKDEKRIFALKEIFNFYTSQHVLQGKTFDEMNKKSSTLSKSEFVKFCDDFNILITKQKIFDILKKVTKDLKTLSFDEFLKAINELALFINEGKKNNIEKKIEDIRKEMEILEKNEEKRKEDEKNNIYNGDSNANNGLSNKNKRENINFKISYKKLFDQVTTSKYEFEKLIGKSEEDILNDFYTFISLDSKEEYMKKLKGFYKCSYQYNFDKDGKGSNSKIYSKINKNTNSMGALTINKKNNNYKFKIISNSKGKDNKKEKEGFINIEHDTSNLNKKDFIYKKNSFSNNNYYQHIENRINGYKYSDPFKDLKAKIDKENEDKKYKISWEQLEQGDMDSLKGSENDLSGNKENKENKEKKELDFMIQLKNENDGLIKNKSSDLMFSNNSSNSNRNSMIYSKKIEKSSSALINAGQYTIKNNQYNDEKEYLNNDSDI